MNKNKGVPAPNRGAVHSRSESSSITDLKKDDVAFHTASTAQLPTAAVLSGGAVRRRNGSVTTLDTYHTET